MNNNCNHHHKLRPWENDYVEWIFNKYMLNEGKHTCLYEEAEFCSIFINFIFYIEIYYLGKQILSSDTIDLLFS